MAMRLDQVKRPVRLTSLSDEMPFDAASLQRSAQDPGSRADHAVETIGHNQVQKTRRNLPSANDATRRVLQRAGRDRADSG